MAEIRRCTDCGTPIHAWGSRCNVCMQTKTMKEIAKQQADTANQVQWAREFAEMDAKNERELAENARKQAEKDLRDILTPNPAKKFDFSESAIIEQQLLSANPSMVALDWKRCLDQINALKPTDQKLLKRCAVWDDDGDLTVSTLRYKMAWYLSSSRSEIELFPLYLEEVKERLTIGAEAIETERIAAEERAARIRFDEWYIRIAGAILLSVTLAVIGGFVYLLSPVFSKISG